MKYEGNPKHKEPWQCGRRGSLCKKISNKMATRLLENSILFGDQRFSVKDGIAYCAKEHEKGKWHGYPVGWKEVHEKVRRQFMEQNMLRRVEIRKFWEGDVD